MSIDYELDRGFGDIRLGLIVLSTDESLEAELAQVVHGHRVNLLHARIPFHPQVTPDSLAQMEQDLPATAALLPARLDAIGYCCTSGATIIGPNRVRKVIQDIHPDVPISTPITAVTSALKSLNVSKIAFVSPYVSSVTAPIRAYLAAEGIGTRSEVSFAQEHDPYVARISEASTKAAMLAAVEDTKADAIFVSCTNLRTFGIIEAVESETGLPVVSSNQALIWHLLRLAGAKPKGWGPGRLFNP